MGTSANPIGRAAIFGALIISVLMGFYYFLANGDGQIAFGLIVIVWSIAGFMYLIFARMNTVQRTGYMSLLFMILVAIMLPFLFLSQATLANSRDAQQYTKTLHYAAGLYTTYCSACHGLLGQGIGAPQLNNSLQQKLPGNPVLDTFTPTDINRFITAGIVDSAAPKTYLMPQWGQDYGGPLNVDDVNALTLLITSGSPSLLKKNPAPSNITTNGFDFVPSFLINSTITPSPANSFQLYNEELAALNAPQGVPADFTAVKTLTIPILDTPTSATSLYGFLVTDPKTQQPNNLVEVKIGTVITWDNKSSALHSVTSGAPGTGDANTWPTFDVAVGKQGTLTFNKAGTFYYYCKYHTSMIGEIVVVP